MSAWEWAASADLGLMEALWAAGTAAPRTSGGDGRGWRRAVYVTFEHRHLSPQHRECGGGGGGVGARIRPRQGGLLQRRMQLLVLCTFGLHRLHGRAQRDLCRLQLASRRPHPLLGGVAARLHEIQPRPELLRLALEPVALVQLRAYLRLRLHHCLLLQRRDRLRLSLPLISVLQISLSLPHLRPEALDGAELLAGRGGMTVTLGSDTLQGLELRLLCGLLPGVLLIQGLQLRLQSAVLAHHCPPLRHHRPPVLAHHRRRRAGGRGGRGRRGPRRGVHGGPLWPGCFGLRHERQQAMRVDVHGQLELEQLRLVAHLLELRLVLLPQQAQLAHLGPQALELLLLRTDGLGLPPTKRLGLARAPLRHRHRHLGRLALLLRHGSLSLERGGLVGHAAQRGGLLLVEGLLPRAR